MPAAELTLDVEVCSECGLCVAVCGYDALVLRPTILEIIHSECVLCDACVVACPTEALRIE
ncbi:MAG: 4Fe-4S binding protein [candidate division Zixibacteria bacterium]|nr:4Fe-4S binding protein [candidate division Zixibacteria bacterium]